MWWVEGLPAMRVKFYCVIRLCKTWSLYAHDIKLKIDGNGFLKRLINSKIVNGTFYAMRFNLKPPLKL